MSRSEVASRYAGSLLQAAADQDKVAALQEQMIRLQEALGVSPPLRSALLNPRVRPQEKLAVLEQLVSGKEALLERFFDLVFLHRRAEDLEDIAQAYVTLADDYLGKADAVVESVVPLDDSQRTGLMKALHERFNKEIRLIEKVNRELIGGIRVRIQGEVMDRSVIRSLGQIRVRLETAGASKEGTR